MVRAGPGIGTGLVDTLTGADPYDGLTPSYGSARARMPAGPVGTT